MKLKLLSLDCILKLNVLGPKKYLDITALERSNLNIIFYQSHYDGYRHYTSLMTVPKERISTGTQETIEPVAPCSTYIGLRLGRRSDDSASPSPRGEHNDHNNEELCIRVVRVYEMEFSNQNQLITEANVSTTKPFCARFIQQL